MQTGHRITLTYNLLVSEHGGSAAMDPQQLPLHRSIKSCMENPGFMANGMVAAVALAKLTEEQVAFSEFIARMRTHIRPKRLFSTCRHLSKARTQLSSRRSKP